MENILSKEMEMRMPYTLLVSSKVTENFESTISPNRNPSFLYDVSKIPTNIENIKEIQSQYIQTQGKLLNNYTDISNNMDNYVSTAGVLKRNNAIYHYTDTQDPNIILHPEESKDIRAAILHDVNEIKLYQNSIYISTSIFVATVFISAILLTKK